MSGEARRVASGLGWIALVSYTNRLSGLIATLILAKLLTPADFGLVAIAAMLIEGLRLFKDMGLSEALIYQKREDPVAVQTANTILVGFNSLLFVLAVGLSPLAARFYDNWQVVPIIVVMSSNLVWDSLRAVPRALIRKTMNFHQLVIPEVIPVVISSVVSIVMALTGYGVWSLVAKTVVHSVLGAALLVPGTPYRLRFGIDRAAARELLHYGQFVAGTTVLLVILYNIDRLYVSKVKGVVALGLFELAMRISELPVKEFSFLVGSVMFPTFARVDRSGASLSPAFLKTLRYTAFVSVPMAIGISVYGPPLVGLIYGAKWDGIGIPLQLLALYAMCRSLSSIIHDVFKATGNPRLMQRFVLFRLASIGLLGVPVLMRFGLNGLCLLVLLTYVCVFFWEALIVSRLLGIALRSSLSVLVAPLTVSIVTIRGIYAALGLHSAPPSMRLLASGITVTVMAYVIAIWVVDRQIVRDIRAIRSRVAA